MPDPFIGSIAGDRRARELAATGDGRLYRWPIGVWCAEPVGHCEGPDFPAAYINPVTIDRMIRNGLATVVTRSRPGRPTVVYIEEGALTDG